MSFSSQPVVIDGKGHLLGRLASIVSKQVSSVFSVWLVWGKKEWAMDEYVLGTHPTRLDPSRRTSRQETIMRVVLVNAEVGGRSRRKMELGDQDGFKDVLVQY